jgi:hypothetical protein
MPETAIESVIISVTIKVSGSIIPGLNFRLREQPHGKNHLG